MTSTLGNCLTVLSSHSSLLWNPLFLTLFLSPSPFKSVLVLTLTGDRWYFGKIVSTEFTAQVNPIQRASLSHGVWGMDSRLRHSLCKDYVFLPEDIKQDFPKEKKGKRSDLKCPDERSVMQWLHVKYLWCCIMGFGLGPIEINYSDGCCGTIICNPYAAGF